MHGGEALAFVIAGDDLVIDGIEQPDDVAFDLDRVRDGDVAVEQVVDGLRDDGLAVAGRAVDEHRVAGIDRRSELVEDLVADDEMRERSSHALARGAPRRRRAVGIQVGLVLRERYRRGADVVAGLQEQRRAGAAGVGDAVAVRRAADEAAANDRNLMLSLQELERRSNDRELQAEPPRQVGAGQLAGEVQRLQRELQDEVERESRLLERLCRSRERNDVSRFSDGGHGPTVQERRSGARLRWAPFRRSCRLARNICARICRARSRAS